MGPVANDAGADGSRAPVNGGRLYVHYILYVLLVIRNSLIHFVILVLQSLLIHSVF